MKKNIIKTMFLFFVLLFAQACSEKEGIVINSPFKLEKITPLKARINDEIIITGSGFNQPITVSFNDFENTYSDPKANIIITPTNENQLKIKIPKGARTGKIKLIKGNSEVISKQTFSVSDTWRKISDFPGEKRSGAISFSGGKNGYLGLGGSFLRNSGFKFYKDLWKYNTESNKWIKVSGFPGDGRIDATAIKKGNKVYVGFGRTPIFDNTHNDMYAYDIPSDSWKKLANIPYSAADQTTSGPGTYLAGNDIYFLGGSIQVAIANFDVKSIYKYNTQNNTWKLYLNKIPKGMFWAQSHTLNGDRIFVGAANSSSFFKHPIKLKSLTSNSTPTFEYLKEYPNFNGSKGVKAPVSFTYKSKIFYGLGRANNKIIKKMAFYENGNWKFTQDFPGKARTGASAFVINDKAYIGGGFVEAPKNTSNYVSDFYEYTIED